MRPRSLPQLNMYTQGSNDFGYNLIQSNQAITKVKKDDDSLS